MARRCWVLLAILDLCPDAPHIRSSSVPLTRQLLYQLPEYSTLFRQSRWLDFVQKLRALEFRGRIVARKSSIVVIAFVRGVWHSEIWQKHWFIVFHISIWWLGASFGRLSPPKPPVTTEPFAKAIEGSYLDFSVLYTVNKRLMA